jgi:4-amino-4-deoxy-L-arabinose transferase-like glycosyltransferase
LPEGFAVKRISWRRLFFSRPAKILALGLEAVLYLVFLLATFSSIPFHPDEATYIYMSRDLDRIFTLGPSSVCWRAGNGSDPLQTERERDCPLARYTIGFARWTGGVSATVSNWDWNRGWDQNFKQGAVPADDLLILSRVPQALLLFLAVLLISRIGWRLGGGAGAISAAVFFGLNSQVLLHDRRAMAEAALLFGMILTITVLMEQKRDAGRMFRMLWLPLMAGAALALATLAKYSGLLLAPVALTGMFFATGERSPRKLLLRGVVRSAVMILGFLAIFLAFNPVFWCDPAGTLSAVITERQRLLGEQLTALRSAAPGLVLDSLPLRLLGVLYESFFAPPAFWDIPNYAKITAAAESAYLAQPLNALTGGGVLSFLFAVLFLYGLGVVIARGLKRGMDSSVWIATIWFLSVFAGIIAEVPILWQRYYLPLLPAAAALSAIAVGAIITKIRKELDRIYRINKM